MELRLTRAFAERGGGGEEGAEKLILRHPK